jgi:hypothetical protein
MGKSDTKLELPPGLKGEKVRRDIATLALTPVNMNLTVTARKVYTVLLYLAQRSTKNEEGGYSAPVMSIVRGSGTHVKMAGVVLEYLQQMTSTNVVFRPVSENEQYTLLSNGPATIADEEDVRVFALLAEARVTKRGGDNWVSWWYPPTIEQQVIDPNRWAVIELDVLAMLTTYTAVALYEIVARYRDSPGQRTPKRPAEFWVPILRGNSNTKDREWRKFKSEFVTPAIAQINNVSDLHVELVEEKYGGRKVVDVQFSVMKKQRVVRNAGGVVDISIATSGLAMGVRDGELDALVEEHGEDRVKRALFQLELRVANKSLDPVGKPVSYLRRVLENLVEADVPAARAAGGSSAARTEGGGGAPAKAINAAEIRNKLLAEFSHRRYECMSAAFADLTEIERASWMDRLAETLAHSTGFARTVRRLKDRDWKSPIVHAQLMRFYAQQGLGQAWAEPTNDELAALRAELQM